MEGEKVHFHPFLASEIVCTIVAVLQQNLHMYIQVYAW